MISGAMRLHKRTVRCGDLVGASITCPFVGRTAAQEDRPGGRSLQGLRVQYAQPHYVSGITGDLFRLCRKGRVTPLQGRAFASH